MIFGAPEMRNPTLGNFFITYTRGMISYPSLKISQREVLCEMLSLSVYVHVYVSIFSLFGKSFTSK